MQRIQLIALDLDGTLLNDSKEVSNESTDAVRKLISRGNLRCSNIRKIFK